MLAFYDKREEKLQKFFGESPSWKIMGEDVLHECSGLGHKGGDFWGNDWAGCYAAEIMRAAIWQLVISPK